MSLTQRLENFSLANLKRGVCFVVFQTAITSIIQAGTYREAAFIEAFVKSEDEAVAEATAAAAVRPDMSP